MSIKDIEYLLTYYYKQISDKKNKALYERQYKKIILNDKLVLMKGILIETDYNNIIKRKDFSLIEETCHDCSSNNGLYFNNIIDDYFEKIIICGNIFCRCVILYYK